MKALRNGCIPGFRRWLVLPAIATFVAGCYREPPPAEEAPLIPRLEQQRGSKTVRSINGARIVGWANREAPLSIINTSTDSLPNGLAAAMVPFLVEWPEGPNDSVLIRNVMVGGNPIEGTCILATIRLPRDCVESVQYVLVRDRDGKKDTAFGHGQLRFIFKPELRPSIVSEGLTQLPVDPAIDDLVISWEAWREPGESYDYGRGLAPDGFALTVRAYRGAYRYLIDAMKGRPWDCFPLDLPDTPDAPEQVLYTSLLLGDSLARRVLGEFVEDGALNLPDDVQGTTLSEDELDAARAFFSRERLPEDPLGALTGEGAISYHLLERSCITLSLLTVDLANVRIRHAHQIGVGSRVQIAPEVLPAWINELADADKTTLLLRLPSALLWIAENQSVLPARSYLNLLDAGLLETTSEGNALRYYYPPEGVTPYGDIRRNIM